MGNRWEQRATTRQRKDPEVLPTRSTCRRGGAKDAHYWKNYGVLKRGTDAHEQCEFRYQPRLARTSALASPVGNERIHRAGIRSWPSRATSLSRSWPCCGGSKWEWATARPLHRTRQALGEWRCESLDEWLRDDFLNGEALYSLKEALIPIEQWRMEYNTRRPHSAPGCRPPRCS